MITNSTAVLTDGSGFLDLFASMPYKYSSKTRFYSKNLIKTANTISRRFTGGADGLPMNADPMLHTYNVIYLYGYQESSRIFLFLRKINSPNIGWGCCLIKKPPFLTGGFVSLLVLISRDQISVCVVFRRPVTCITQSVLCTDFVNAISWI